MNFWNENSRTWKVHLWPETPIDSLSTLGWQSTTNLSNTFRFLLIKKRFGVFDITPNCRDTSPLSRLKHKQTKSSPGYEHESGGRIEDSTFEVANLVSNSTNYWLICFYGVCSAVAGSIGCFKSWYSYGSVPFSKPNQFSVNTLLQFRENVWCNWSKFCYRSKPHQSSLDPSIGTFRIHANFNAVQFKHKVCEPRSTHEMR